MASVSGLVVFTTGSPVLGSLGEGALNAAATVDQWTTKEVLARYVLAGTHPIVILPLPTLALSGTSPGIQVVTGSFKSTLEWGLFMVVDDVFQR